MPRSWFRRTAIHAETDRRRIVAVPGPGRTGGCSPLDGDLRLGDGRALAPRARALRGHCHDHSAIVRPNPNDEAVSGRIEV